MSPCSIALLVGLFAWLSAEGSRADTIRIPLSAGTSQWDDAMSRSVGMRPLDPRAPEAFHIWTDDLYTPIRGFEITATRARRCHGREEYHADTGILMAPGYCGRWFPLPGGDVLETLRSDRRYDGRHMRCNDQIADGPSYTVAGATGGSRFAWTWTDTGGCYDRMSQHLVALELDLEADASRYEVNPATDQRIR